MLYMQTKVTIDGTYNRETARDIASKLPPGSVHDYWHDTCRTGEAATAMWIVHPFVDTDDHGAHLAVRAVTEAAGGRSVTDHETIVHAPDGAEWEHCKRLHTLDIDADRDELTVLQAHVMEQAEAFMAELIGGFRALGIPL